MPANIDTLTTRFEADLSKFEEQMKKMVAANDDAIGKVTKKHKEAHDGLASLWGKSDIGEALNKTFSNARLGVLEEGGAKIGIFGSALEALGPAGLTAAAGLAAVGAAMEFAKSAAEYSEEIANTAGKLGITTKALQEYNFAALGSGVSTDAMKTALEAGNKVLGDFQSNMASTKSRKVFDALGISQEDAQKAKTITDLLPEIADKIKGLSAAEQAAVAKRLGMEDILPVLQKGKEGVEELLGEADKTGAVLDSQLIQKGKEAAEALKESSQIVSVNLYRAFVGLAPVIEACVKLVEGLARTLADAVETIGGISHMSRAAVTDSEKETDKALGNWGAAARFGGAKLDPKTGMMTGGGMTGALGAVGMYNYFAGQKQREQDRLKELDGIDAADAAKTHAGTSEQLVATKPKKAKAAPQDQTDQFDKAANDAYDGAMKDAVAAVMALTKSIDLRAEYEKQQIDVETDKKKADLKKQELDIMKSKNDAHKAEQLQLVQAAMKEADIVAALKKQAIDKQAQLEKEQEYEAHQDKINSTMSQIASIYASMAPTASQRNQINTKNLLDNQFRERQKFDNETQQMADSGQFSGDDGQERLTNRNQERDQMLNLQAAQRDQLQYQQRNPMQQYVDSLKDVQTQMQQVGVKGMQGLTDAITDAIMHTKSLGQAFHEVALQIVADLVKIGVEQMITRPLANTLFGTQGTSIAAAASPSNGLLGSLFSSFGHLFGFQTGTDFAPGGLAMVGEGGPEMVSLPRGSQVLPNNLLRNAMGAPQGGGVSQSNYNLTTVVNADNSVLTDTVKTWVLAAHNSAIETARRASAQDFADSRRNSFS